MHRHTCSRAIRYGEGYLQIPTPIARQLNITNSNSNNNNLYTCNSADGFLTNATLKTNGCSNKGNIYAKQLNGNRNLKLLGDWFNHINAEKGDLIGIEFTSPSQILLTKVH